jgi:hypothetical protein
MVHYSHGEFICRWDTIVARERCRRTDPKIKSNFEHGQVVMGVIEIIGGFKGGGIGSFILGAVNVLVGLLLLGSPLAAALAVPLVFGVLLLIQGVASIIFAFRVRT